MNRQHYQLLTQLIYGVGNPLSQTKVAAIMGVGDRSVRNYVAAANDFLRKSGLRELSIYPNGDIAFEGTQKQAIAIQERIFQNDFYNYHLSPFERVQIIILLLLDANGYITITELTQQLYVSKGTLLKDIDEVKYYFQQKKICFDDVKTRGFRLAISETQRRDLLRENMDAIISCYFFFPGSTNTVSTGVLYGFVMKLLNGVKLRSILEKLVKAAEQAHGIQLNDFDFQSIIHFLMITAKRIADGHVVQQIPDDIQHSNSVAFRFGRQLLDETLALFSIDPTETEYSYLTWVLCRKGVGENNSEFVNSIDLHLATKSFIYKISGDIGISLLADNDLQQFLASHICNVIRRAGKNSLQAENQDQIVSNSQYEDCFDAVRKNIYILENALGHYYDTSEISMIMLHITAAVERYRRNLGAPKAIVVCNSGIATAKYLAEKLLRSFYIDIVSTTSALRLDDIRAQYKHDLIITTIPLDIEDIPCIWVSQMLNRQDMFRIYDSLLTISGQFANVGDNAAKSSETQTDTPPLFLREHVAAHCQAEDWRQAIRQAGQLLLDSGSIEAAYIEAMVEAVEKNGPYIVFIPGVALAHAMPLSSDIRFCASVARFDPPVPFHAGANDPVHLVVAVQTTDAEDHTQELFRIMDRICNREIYERMIAATNTDELWRIVNSTPDDSGRERDGNI